MLSEILIGAKKYQEVIKVIYLLVDNIKLFFKTENITWLVLLRDRLSNLWIFFAKDKVFWIKDNVVSKNCKNKLIDLYEHSLSQELQYVGSYFLFSQVLELCKE